MCGWQVKLCEPIQPGCQAAGHFLLRVSIGQTAFHFISFLHQVRNWRKHILLSRYFPGEPGLGGCQLDFFPACSEKKIWWDKLHRSWQAGCQFCHPTETEKNANKADLYVINLLVYLSAVFSTARLSTSGSICCSNGIVVRCFSYHISIVITTRVIKLCNKSTTTLNMLL